jgi:hypothetical protein
MSDSRDCKGAYSVTILNRIFMAMNSSSVLIMQLRSTKSPHPSAPTVSRHACRIQSEQAASAATGHNMQGGAAVLLLTRVIKVKRSNSDLEIRKFRLEISTMIECTICGSKDYRKQLYSTYLKTVLKNMAPQVSVSDSGSMILRKDDSCLTDYTMSN